MLAAKCNSLGKRKIRCISEPEGHFPSFLLCAYGLNREEECYEPEASMFCAMRACRMRKQGNGKGNRRDDLDRGGAEEKE